MNLFVITLLFNVFHRMKTSEYLSEIYTADSPSSADRIKVKCLVCLKVVEEIEAEIEKIDPKKKIDLGAFRLDHKGDATNANLIEYRRSEAFLTELMESVCKKMEDYVRARNKSDNQLVVVPLFDENKKLDPNLDKVHIIQDDDLNKSLKFYCESILGEHDEEFVKVFKKPQPHKDVALCSQLCQHTSPSDDGYEFEEHEEL